MSDLVSIGIPCFNAERTIAKAIESCLCQTYPLIEIVISDNGSTDLTLKIAQKYATTYQNIFVLSQTTNRGPTKNFQTVFEHSKGAYFMWLAADDWLGCETVDSLVSALRNDSKSAVAFGTTRLYDKDERRQMTDASGRVESISGSRFHRLFSYYRTVALNNEFYGLFRRGNLASNAIKKEIGNDWHVFASHLVHGKAVYVPDAEINRRTGGTSTSLQRLVSVIGLKRCVSVFPILYLLHGTFSTAEHVAITPLDRLLCRAAAFFGVLLKRDWWKTSIISFGQSVLRKHA